jgi:glycosyltransferase involved in cell wall biosynthesis
MTPTVSVCIVTYQHAAFIRQAIEGALAQQTDFPFEVLIGEDGSIDGTREICLEYAQRQSDRIRVSLRDRAQVLPGGRAAYIARNFIMTLREAHGEFIALCEGDDYWTDPTKLQRQVDYLRANPDCVGCFHDTKLVDAKGQTLRESYFQSEQEKFTQRDALESLLSREPTCSLVFRRLAITEPLPEWFLGLPCDLYLDILLTNHGSLGFVRRNMGAYRKHANGIWSGQREANKIIELIIRYKLLLADPSFVKYKDLLLQKIADFQTSLFTRKDATEEIERLERVVQEQTQAVKSMEDECSRLTCEAKVAQTETKRSAQDAQQHIDELLVQVEKLSATSRQQDQYIAIMEKERDRLLALTATQANDSQHYVKVIEEQTAYIKVLEAQRALSAQK